jgi:HlyD family secretion protein
MSETVNDYADLLEGGEHRWRNRLIWLAAAAVLVAVAVVIVLKTMVLGGGSATAAVQTAKVERGSISKTVSTTGTAAAQSTTNLSFTQSGKVTAVNVKLGQEVKAGDVLAELDSTSLQQALTTAQVNLSSAQTRLKQLLEGSTASELASADQSLTQAQANYDEAVRALQDLQAGPTASEQLSAQQAVTSAQAQLDQAKRALSDLTAGPTASERLSAEQAVTSAESQLAQAQASRAQLDSASQDAIAAAEQAVTRAQSALDNANRTASNAADSLNSAGLALMAEEDAYCTVWNNPPTPTPSEWPSSTAFCMTRAEPISTADETILLSIKASGTPAALATHAASVLAANSSYKSALATKESADAAVQSAQADLAAAQSDLDEARQGPSSEEIAKADAAVTAAQQALDLAKAKLAELGQGPTQSELDTARENVRTATAALDTAKAKLAELNKGPTESELAKAQDAVNTAAAALAATQAKHDEVYAGSDPEDIALQRDQVRLAQLSVERAQKDLDGAKLIAPFDGTVAALNIAVGDIVGASSTTAPIILNTPNAVRLNLTVTESDLPSIKVGQSGIATFDALQGSAFPIVIDAVGTNPTTTQGVVTYQVRAHFVTGAEGGTAGAAPQAAPGGPRSIFGGAPGASATPPAGVPAAGATPPAGGRAPGARATAAAGTPVPAATPPAGASTPQAGAVSEARPLPGMNATVTIIVDQRQNVLVVPDRAIQTQGGNSVVEVRKDDGSTEMVVVQTGLSNGTNTEITAGLEEGQTVILPGRATTTASAQTTAVPGFQGGPIIQFGGPEGGGGAPP